MVNKVMKYSYNLTFAFFKQFILFNISDLYSAGTQFINLGILRNIL